VQPNAVPDPPSISVFDPAASRGGAIFATSADDFVGRLAQVARLCAWLADSGTSIGRRRYRSPFAPPSSSARAPNEELGSVLA
jgi:hypothetical protein